jgi:two-component system, OmpR family, sensor kinase
MNRLWMRFSLVFGLTALLGPVILASIGILTIQTGILRLFLRNELTAPGSLADQLAQYYQEHDSWEGVTELVASYDRSLPHMPERVGLTLVFADEAQRLIYGTTPITNIGENGPQQLISIVVDGRIRGYLNIVQQPITPTSLQYPSRPFILGQISNLLLAFALISAVLGLTAGVVAGRTLVAPLAQLAATARRLGQHDFTARAEVKGSSELREVGQAFNEMAHDLEQAETLRRNLVEDVAHELRTPLAVLQANLQALLDGVYPLEQAEIEKLMDQTELLHRLVNDLRELSQAEAHQLPLHTTTVALNELIAQTVENFQSTAKKQEVHIEVNMPAEAITMTGDRGRLQQVLNNLIQNALTHTPIKGLIRINLHQDAKQIYITIKDTGEGIPTDHLAYVFDRFYRVDRSRSRETGGTGLGLPIAKAIAELHGGSIHVASDGQPGRGSTFTLAFPWHPSA